MSGRPRRELSTEQKRNIGLLSARIRKREQELVRLRDELALRVAAVAEDGASRRAIAECVGSSKSAVALLLRRGESLLAQRRRHS
jgi:hypothetical protein